MCNKAEVHELLKEIEGNDALVHCLSPLVMYLLDNYMCCYSYYFIKELISAHVASIYMFNFCRTVYDFIDVSIAINYLAIIISLDSSFSKAHRKINGVFSDVCMAPDHLNY